ncbi:MAG: RecQ family zinc-binding domain-containing protein, partial [Flavobacteriaceae bacterium]|nr:RecQ family zinc-binding domain-containing protein [Flavobacteriaceae bacterium]
FIYNLFLVPREDERTIYLKSSQINHQNKLKQEKFNKIVQFLKNNTVCRNQQLLHYFGEENPIKCNICEVCLNEKAKINKISTKEIESQLLEILQNQAKSINELLDIIEVERKLLLDILQLLIERDIISLNLQNKFQLK